MEETAGTRSEALIAKMKQDRGYIYRGLNRETAAQNRRRTHCRAAPCARPATIRTLRGAASQYSALAIHIIGMPAPKAQA
jgi:hypothetical protein